MARRALSVPKTSTSICVPLPMPKSPPRIFEPGRQPIWRLWRSASSKVSTARRRPRRNVVQAVEAVSKMLGNTPAICRKCYIHPAVFDGYLDGSLLQALKKRADARLANPQSGPEGGGSCGYGLFEPAIGSIRSAIVGSETVPPRFDRRTGPAKEALGRSCGRCPMQSGHKGDPQVNSGWHPASFSFAKSIGGSLSR